MTSRVPAQRLVPEKKITGYLLDKEHEDGGPKAVFFLARGFSAERWREMAEALSAHPDRNPVDETIATDWGAKYVVRCSIETPDGCNPCILTVWMDRGKDLARFVTAYPADEHP